jgi:hypothetical protein
MMEETYSNAARLAALEEIYRSGISPVPLPGGWICDMTLLGMYALSMGNRCIDLSDERDGAVYDYAFGEPEGFQYNPYKHIKRLRRDHRRFYGIRGGRRVFFP